MRFNSFKQLAAALVGVADLNRAHGFDAREELVKAKAYHEKANALAEAKALIIAEKAKVRNQAIMAKVNKTFAKMMIVAKKAIIERSSLYFEANRMAKGLKGEMRKQYIASFLEEARRQKEDDIAFFKKEKMEDKICRALNRGDWQIRKAQELALRGLSTLLSLKKIRPAKLVINRMKNLVEERFCKAAKMSEDIIQSVNTYLNKYGSEGNVEQGFAYIAENLSREYNTIQAIRFEFLGTK